MWLEIVAGVCLAWYVFIAIVCSIGYIQLRQHYSRFPSASSSSSLSLDQVPHVTIIRPVKGIDPFLYECLASTFRQDYPTERLTTHLCIASRDDPAYPILERLSRDFQSFDVKLFVEKEDCGLQDRNGNALGPNPKIRNMSRGYRESRGDIIWIIDCNVWVGHGVCGRMVDHLCGLANGGTGKKHKFVHHLPICVDVGYGSVNSEAPDFIAGPRKTYLSLSDRPCQMMSPKTKGLGGRLEEVFLASSHAKMYTAINMVAVAPCIVGKSNMFRRSHLDYLTALEVRNGTPSSPSHNATVGIDYFSYNICEDHLIGDLLWRGRLPNEQLIQNHGLVLGDLAIQPIGAMGIGAYVARRVRWLRVRKYTVTLATLVEPGTESFLCSIYGAFALTKLHWFEQQLGIPSTWTAFWLLWMSSIIIWASVDWTVYILLHSGGTVEMRSKYEEPAFVRPVDRIARRPFLEWLAAWLGREILALPIWIWAFWGGATVIWRDRKYWVDMDMKVHEVGDQDSLVESPQIKHDRLEARKARTD